MINVTFGIHHETVIQTPGERRSGNLDELQRSIQELERTKEESARTKNEYEQRFADMARALDAVKNDVHALIEDRTRADQFAPLAEQVAKLERQLETIIAQAARPHKTDGGQPVDRPRDFRPSLCWRSLEAPRAIAITSHTNLAAIFSTVLQALGMWKTIAQVFAEESAAAVAGRQTIFLQGAFASQVAHGLARSVGGPANACLAIPIGVQDTAQVRLAIKEAFSSHSGRIGGLVIEGVNRVPFDVLKDIISESVDPHVGNKISACARLAVFGTISRGLASLPVDAMTTGILESDNVQKLARRVEESTRSTREGVKFLSSPRPALSPGLRTSGITSSSAAVGPASQASWLRLPRT